MKADRQRGFAFPNTSQATREDVRLLMKDRPPKLTGDSSGLKRGGGTAERRCGNCFHLYSRFVGGRTVCEIVRPADDSSVQPGDVCRLWSHDGVRYPMLSGAGRISADDLRGRNRY